MNRQQKELEIYRKFFMQDNSFLERFEKDWGYINDSLQMCKFQLEKLPEIYIDILYEWCSII